jgi:hypothetical protein
LDGPDGQYDAPPSLPAKSAFFRVKVCGLMARSTVFESISTRPSARNVIKLAQCRSA